MNEKDFDLFLIFLIELLIYIFFKIVSGRSLENFFPKKVINISDPNEILR